MKLVHVIKCGVWLYRFTNKVALWDKTKNNTLWQHIGGVGVYRLTDNKLA